MKVLLMLTTALSCMLLAACAPVAAPGTPPSFGSEWEALPKSSLSARQGAVAVWIDDRFLLIGGSSRPSCPPNASCVASDVPFLRDGASYDPADRRWRAIAAAPFPIAPFSSTAVIGDDLYLVSPSSETDRQEVFLRYDLDRDEWSRLPAAPESAGPLVAAGDRIVAIAGSDENGPVDDLVFDPESERWRTLPADPLGPSFNRNAVWIGDRLLLTGHELVDSPGADGPSLTRMAVLDADLTTWKRLPDSPIIGDGPIAVDGLVVFPGLGEADGGEIGNWGRFYPEGGIWNPTTGEWKALPGGGPATSRPDPALGAVGAVDGQAVLIGGALLDPVARTWRSLPGSPLPERYSPAVAVGPGAVLIWGGTAPGRRGNLDDGALLAVP